MCVCKRGVGGRKRERKEREEDGQEEALNYDGGSGHLTPKEYGKET